MKDAEFFPAALLGKGDISLIKTGKFPLVEVPTYLKEMYCVQLGFHLYSFTYQIIMKSSDKKFMEYLLHHGLTILLITYSYCTNFINNGSIVLLVHDISDATLVFARSYAYMAFKNAKFSAITYFSAVGVWIYTRLFVLPVYGIYPVWQILFGIEGKYRFFFFYGTKAKIF
jgi:ceramide synthetase